MYLKSIKLAGFKSFVDPTQAIIRGNLSAVVGPNGCGKSNIVDAVRWVIGESSAKQLRGQSMTDVIFNGSTHRKPAGRAMVELHFDNSAGRIQGEYAQYNELAIRRTVDRSGQSSYFLNGTACRRRDIIDVFLGTGLGPRSYSIIEQGMIAQLIEAKPDDMRQYLEEAAGISKYKERRRETENRMRHTQDNLDRLNDIRLELEKQLKHLKRQATIAESYTQLKQEERDYSTQMKALHWKSLDQRAVEQQQQLNQTLVLLEQQTATQRDAERKLETVAGELEAQNQTYHAAQKNHYQVAADIGRIEQHIEHQHEQKHQAEKALQELIEQRNLLMQSTTEYQTSMSTLDDALTQLRPESQAMQTEYMSAQQALEAAETEMQAIQTACETAQRKMAALDSEHHVAQTKMEYHTQQLQKWRTQQQQRQTQLAGLPIDSVRIALEPLQTEVHTLTEQLEHSRSQLTHSQQLISTLRSENKNRQQTIQQQQQQLHILEREYAKLDGLQQAALGMNNEGTKPWVERMQLQHHPRLGQKMAVETGWEQAVETVLSGYFDAICLESQDTTSHIEGSIQDLMHLTTGRITLLEKSQRDEAVQPRLHWTTLISKVQSAWSPAPWLHDIYTASSLSEALSIRSQLHTHESVITPDGIWLGKNWARISRVTDPQHGVLEREKILLRHAQQIEQAREAFHTLSIAHKTAETALAEEEQLRDQTQATYQQQSAHLGKIQKELSVHTSRLEALNQEQKRLQHDIASIISDIEKASAELCTLQTACDLLKTQLTETTEQHASLMRARDQQRTQLEHCRRAAQTCKQKMDSLMLTIRSHENQQALLRQTMTRDEKQLTQSADKQDILHENVSQAQRALCEYEFALQEKLALHAESEITLSTAEQASQAIRQQLKNIEQQKQTAIDHIAGIKTELEKIRMGLQEMTVRQETIQEQLAESQNTLATVIENMPAEADATVWEERLNHIQQRIQRLGPINLAAIDEYKTGSERNDYLIQQNADLTAALHTLQEAMRKIDRETKIRFTETFEQVNQGFKTIFPQVFGGGQASLVLSGEEDILTAGVLVQAQPPGKRNASIHMLSGGEKALTAIALVFAMFQLNPAPFCILDEVDAPLDDLNVGRFCQLVKEMSKETQFLVISHNKTTISKADHLMGVTMQEAGVSRLVAVDMQEALELVKT